MTEKFRVEGLKGVLDVLTAMPREIATKNGSPIRKILRDAAKIIQTQAQQNIDKGIAKPNKDNAPSTSSGALKQSVQVKRRSLPVGVNGERVWIGVVRLKGKLLEKTGARKGIPTSFYAQHLESGTEKMEAQPFWTPAVEAKKKATVDYIVRELPIAVNNLLKRMKQKYRVRI